MVPAGAVFAFFVARAGSNTQKGDPMTKRRESDKEVAIRGSLRTGLSGLAIPLLCLLLAVPTAANGSRLNKKSDFERLYDPGIPPSLSVEWSYPTGFSLGIDSGYKLRIGDDSSVSTESPASLNTFPLSFSMKYSIYESSRISQSIGIGLGPYFLHEGEMPIQLKDVDVTGSSTCATEWISHLTQDLYVNLRMKYTHVFQSVVNEIPLWDFTTWLGLNLRW